MPCCKEDPDAVTEKDAPSEASSEDEDDRGNWSGKLDFLMSCISYAVGLGNIWRFPYLCYRNGGAVFLIPYITFLVLCGMPLFFMEVSYGQFASLSPIAAFNFSPIFRGVGAGMVIISGIVCIYYNVIITWTFFYFFKSFYPTLPWSTCDNSWNTPACSMKNVKANYNGTEPANITMEIFNVTKARRVSPSEEYWENHVLELSDGIDNMGGIRWELFGCLVLAWVVVFLCLIKGVKSSGKVVYFTATFPYIVLLCLLIRGLTLPGSFEGIKFYVIPKWEKLLSLQIWGEAAMQIFYSIGAGWGALVSYSSYNKFNHDCYLDARVVPILNSGTSIFSGFVIFSIIGFMAHETGSAISEVITQGPGLVFVVYPEAIAKFPLPQLWSVLFFTMLLCVGVGSQFAMFNCVVSAFGDMFPVLRKKNLLVLALCCVTEFLLGIPCITRGGIYFLQIMDWYSSTFSLMILSFIECVLFAWVYGVRRFYQDIELMIGYKPNIWWKILWCGLTPVTITFVFMFSVVIHTPVTYGDYDYPEWAIGVGWIFALCSIVPVPAVAIYVLVNEEGSLFERVKKTIKPNKAWGPSLEKNREKWNAMLKGDNMDDVELAAKNLNSEKGVFA